MLWQGFQRPKKVEVNPETMTDTYAMFTAQPFERGFATTVGTTLRRCLLSSIEGPAVTAVNIEGVLHEFSSLSGVVEDVTEIILNLKQVAMRYHGEEPRTVHIEVKGPGVLKAGDFAVDPSIEVANPDFVIATLNDEGHVKMDARVGLGRGYVSADKNQDESMSIGWIALDSVHSPVRRVNFRLEAARLGRATDYEKLVLEVWTNGTLTPAIALSRAATLLKEHLTIFIDAEDTLAAMPTSDEVAELSGLDALLGRTVDDLDLSVRSANCLKNADIHTLRDLVRRSEKDMLETKNFGRKSLEEVQDLLGKLGLAFGMEVTDGPSVGA